jgi:hypothetical protein
MPSFTQGLSVGDASLASYTAWPGFPRLIQLPFVDCKFTLLLVRVAKVRTCSVHNRNGER